MVEKVIIIVKSKLKVFVLALCGFVICAYAQNTLTVNVGQATYKIERAIYGHLLENLGRDIYNGLYVGTSSTISNTSGFRNDILQAFIDQGMPCLEWPGGCASVGYHWADGMGSKSSRPGGDMSNGVGTAEYFDLCSRINSIPYITCSIHNSVAEMTAWLKCIDTTPAWKNNLKYWKMGNEEWNGCSSVSYTAYDFVQRYKQYVAGIPASYANKLVRIAEAGTDPSWTSVVMDSLMGKMEAVSYHYYSVINWGNKGPSLGFTEAQYYAQLVNAYDLENKLTSFEAVMNPKDPNNTIGIMVDEWGAWLNPLDGGFYQQSTVRDAVLAVMSLNIFNNHCKRVKMALAAQAVNVIYSSMLTQNPPTTALVKTPTYYVLKMLRPHQNAKMIPVNLTCATIQNIPVISASASIDSLNTIHISLGNMHATASQTLTITLSGTSATYATVGGQIVNGPADTSYNDFNIAEKVNIQNFPSSNYTLSGTKLTVTLPAHSVVMLTLPPTTGIVPQGANRIHENLSISTGFGGKIIVSSVAMKQTPLRLTLYGTDGRMIDATTRTNTEGSSRVEWQPANNNIVNGVYIVKVKGEGISESQRILFTR